MISRFMILPPALRFALRDLREGLRGFRIFFACLVLGISAMAGVGSLSAALLAGMADESRTLLAGDVDVQLLRRPATLDERQWLEQAGTVSQSVSLRSNAFSPQNGERALVEVRAADHHYPLYGELLTSPALPQAEMLAKSGALWGAVIDETLADRLGLKIGDRIQLGNTSFHVRAFITHEPDRANSGFLLGPRVMIAYDALQETGLIQPGSLHSYSYKLRLSPDFDLEAWLKTTQDHYGGQGWRIRTHNKSAPALRRVVEQMGVFLTLVGLTALIVGGVGVGNAVRAWLDRKRNSIATFKILGATRTMIFTISLLEVMLLASLAILVGSGLGAGLPLVFGDYLSDHLPVPPRFGLYPQPLLSAALYGFLITLAFSIWPLGRACDMPAAQLFRDQVTQEVPWPARPYVFLVTATVTLLAFVTWWLSALPELALGFLLGAGLILGLLWGVGWLIARLAALMPRVQSPALRLAVANLHRPGAATGPVVMSLGLGLTLFTVMTLVEGTFSRELSSQIPDRAPAFFFIDIQSDQHDAFLAVAQAIEGVGRLQSVPSLRGTISKINNIPAQDWEHKGGAGWVLRGDRGLSYATDVPDGNEIVAGSWWTADYQGPPLVSFSAKEAYELGITVGDTITVMVLGREITATITSLRALDWDSFQFNFVILFDPHTLASAPHGYMTALEASGDAEGRAYRQLTDSFPNVTAIRIKDVLTTVTSIIGNVALGVRATAAITILAGILVLAGALAAGQRARFYDAAIFRMLGATRRNILTSILLEYALLGCLTGVAALLLGGIAGYVIVENVLELSFTLMPQAMLVTVGTSILATLVFGLAGTWQSLRVRPARLLRST